jgi:hypothetical protein
MNSENIGLDVHQATISIAVMDSTGKVVMESILETKGATILEFFEGLRGTLSVTFEEGTWAAWLYDLLKPQVAKLVVCDPRKNALLKDGNKRTGSMPVSWRSCCTQTNSARSTMARQACVCCASWPFSS